MRTLFIIGAGGFIGSIARYLVQVGFARFLPIFFPYGTLAVNLGGCFLIGIVYALADRGSLINPEWRFFLTTGLCGGFTTFSTFTYEAYHLLREGQYAFFSLYVAMSVVIGILATFFAVIIIRSL